MKKILLCAIMALLSVMNAVAYTDEQGVVYNLDEDAQTYAVTGYTDDVKSEIVIASEVNGVPVTRIGDEAFQYCSDLTSITIPGSVTSIGVAAFDLCAGLTSITIPNSMTTIGSSAFSGCEGLTSVTIPNSVTSIGSYAFRGCYSLTSITIPNSVTFIGMEVFGWCIGLTSVTINSTEICSWFSGLPSIKEVFIGDSVTSIGSYAFYDCSGLTSITIPNSVTSIGGYAFSGCYSLPVIDNIRYADTYLIEAVDKTLTTYNIKEGTRFIGHKAFYDCENLTSITIPNSVTSIDDYAFWECI